MVSSLATWGVTCVEHLKELKEFEWNNIFDGETPITKRVATQVFSQLMETGECNPKKCATQLAINRASVRSSSKQANTSVHRLGRDDGTSLALQKFCFTRDVTKAPKVRRRRLERNQRRNEVISGLINNDKGNPPSSTANSPVGVDSVSASINFDDDKDGDEEVIPGNPLRFLPSDWRAAICGLSKNLKNPAP